MTSDQKVMWSVEQMDASVVKIALAALSGRLNWLVSGQHFAAPTRRAATTACCQRARITDV